MRDFFTKLWADFSDRSDAITHALAFVVIIPFISLGYSSIMLVINAMLYPNAPIGETAEILRDNPVTLKLYAYFALLLLLGALAYCRLRFAHLPIFLALSALAPADAVNRAMGALSPMFDFQSLLQMIIGDVASFVVYVVAAMVIFFWVLPRGGLLRAPVSPVILLLLVEAIPQALGLYLPTYDFIFEGYFTSPLNVVIFIALLAFLRGLVKIFRENKTVFADMRRVPEFRQLRNKALALWAPMGLVFVLFMGAGFFWQFKIMQPFLINQVVNNTPTQAQVKGCAAEEISFDSLSRALQVFAARNNCQLQAEMQILTKGADRIAKDTGDDFQAYADARLPNRFPGTKARKCKFGKRGYTNCLASNAAKGVLNSGYIVARAAFLREIVNVADATGGSIEEKRRAIDEAISSRANVLTDNIQLRIYQTGVALNLTQLLLTIYAVLVLIKSFLIVFARVLYSSVGIGRDGLDEEARPKARKAPGKIKVHGAQTKLAKGKGRVWYFIFRVLGPNAIDMRRIPQFLTMIYGRMRKGLYVMCRVDGTNEAAEKQVELKVDLPGNIIEWHIHEGEMVYVNLTDLIGFEGSCKLGWKVSFHISSLVFGRVVYFTVTGPGTIYLASKAESLAGNKGEALSIMHASSLVAWSQNCEFHLKSSLKSVDMFFSGYSIAKVDRADFLVAYDKSQSRRVGAGRGLWRSAITFLMPF